MDQRIAIESNLTPVKNYLVNKGYNVESINFGREYSHQAEKYDAIVITGMNNNFLGVEDIATKAIIVNAEGKTPEQVYHELQDRL